MKFIKLISLLYTISSFLLSFQLEIKPQFGISHSSNLSFSIPFIINYNINDNLSIKHSNRIYNLNHPHLRYLHYTKSRKNTTAITEESYIKYSNKFINFIIGRKYLDANNKLITSDFSTSVNLIPEKL